MKNKIVALVVALLAILMFVPNYAFADPVLNDDEIVCKINDIGYTSLRDAGKAAHNGDTIVVVKDFKEVGNYAFPAKKLTIDLNNHTITVGTKPIHIGYNPTEITITGKGVIQEENANLYPIVVKPLSQDVAEAGGKVILNIGKDVTLIGWAGLALEAASSGANQSGVIVNIEGTLITKPDTSGEGGNALYVNGQLTNTEYCPIINLNGATLKGIQPSKPNSSYNGIYLAGYTDTTIVNSNIQGNTGIEIRSGKLTVKGEDTQIIGNATPTSLTPNGNGSTTVGAGIAVAQHGTKKPIDVNVYAGNISGYTAFYQANPQNNPKANADTMISNLKGGNFTAINGGTNAIGTELPATPDNGFGKINITGGKYSSNPSNYIANGYSAKLVEDMYIITPVAKINDIGYDSLEEAIAAAKEGDTITLLANCPDLINVPNMNLTIECGEFALLDKSQIKTPARVEFNGTKVVFTYVNYNPLNTLFFNSFGGTEFPNVQAKPGTVIDLANYIPTKANATFDGWYLNNEKVNEVKLDSNIILNAKWIENSAPIEPEKPKFTDVEENSFYKDAIDWAVENQITNGKTTTTFEPNDICTRAEAVTFLWRAAGKPVVSGETPFKDIDSNAYYYDAVVWGVENGIVKGVALDLFAPEKTCDRGEIITFLGRMSNANVEFDPTFIDVHPNDYFANSVSWAIKEGIAKGMTENTFEPKTQCTRGHIITFMYRYYV